MDFVALLVHMCTHIRRNAHNSRVRLSKLAPCTGVPFKANQDHCRRGHTAADGPVDQIHVYFGHFGRLRPSMLICMSHACHSTFLLEQADVCNDTCSTNPCTQRIKQMEWRSQALAVEALYSQTSWLPKLSLHNIMFHIQRSRCPIASCTSMGLLAPVPDSSPHARHSDTQQVKRIHEFYTENSHSLGNSSRKCHQFVFGGPGLPGCDSTPSSSFCLLAVCKR